jgi:hypothetical protein
LKAILYDAPLLEESPLEESPLEESLIAVQDSEIGDTALAPAAKTTPVRKPSREWFEKFQQRVDRAFAAQRI